jgi:glutamate dehydrogenase
VLEESYAQALALSLERRQAGELLDLHARLISDLERRGMLDRDLHTLPCEPRIRELNAARRGLTGPELSNLLCCVKAAVKMELIESDVPEDEYLRDHLVDSLPARLPERLRAQMRGHRLRREIIAAGLANSIVDRQGTTFVSRLAEETDVRTPDIARAYASARAVFDMGRFGLEVKALDDLVDEQIQVEMLLAGRRLITRATRWLLRNQRASLDIAATVADYAPAAAMLREVLPGLLSSLQSETWRARVDRLTRAGVPSTLGSLVAAMDALFFTFDVVESARGTSHPVRRAAGIHFALEHHLELAWLRDHILALPRTNLWQTLARAGLRDELYDAHRALTASVLSASPTSVDVVDAIDRWIQAQGRGLDRYVGALQDIRAAPGSEFTTLLVAVRELAKLAPQRGD